MEDIEKRDGDFGESDTEKDLDEPKATTLSFGVTDVPPISITILYGIQICLFIISGSVTASYAIFANICAGDNHLLLAQLIGTSLFMVGVATLLQVSIGVRLPISQGSSFLFLAPIISSTSSGRWTCPEPLTNATLLNSTDPYITEPWIPKINEVSGSLAAASVMNVLVGAFGLVGFLSRFIGPLTVTPCIALISVTLYEAALPLLHQQWGIAIFTAMLIVLFSIVLEKQMVPLPNFNFKDGCRWVKLPLFKIFASNLALVISWIFCLILTSAGAFTDDPQRAGYFARTDVKLGNIQRAPWFFFPYPGQWGMPTITVGMLTGMLAACMGSMIESIGDYYATAKVCQVPPPPIHALNRGIGVEGLASILSGLCGACHATTSYSNMMGFIAFSGMASRVTWYVAGAVFLLAGMFGKIGALLSCVPSPVVGGLMIVSLGMVFSVSIMNLESCNMHLSRNQMILGMAMFIGVCSKQYTKQYRASLATGNYEADGLVLAVLSNGPLVGAFVGFVLDNIIPGSRKDRGLFDFNAVYADDAKPSDASLYDLPWTSNIQTSSIFRYIPFLQCYKQTGFSCCSKSKGPTHTVNSEGGNQKMASAQV